MTVASESSGSNADLIGLDTLHALDGLRLPGGRLAIAAYESALADHALLAPDVDTGSAHPFWLLVLALRGMGVDVDQLCAMLEKRPDDTLLFGTCELAQSRAIRVGRFFDTTAVIGPVERKHSRSGAVLDLVTVRVAAYDVDDPDPTPIGEVAMGYIFKRATR
ncbi:MAG: hypothetical protein ACT4QG_18880 [Sporichthyaceae bacterium]